MTLAPLSLPQLAVHARTLEEARFELTLALDDRISRAHPRHLWKYCRPGEGELQSLPLELLPVQRGEERVTSPLVVDALESAAHAGHTEVRLLETELRFWFKAKGRELSTQASALMTEHLKELAPDALLRLRSEGKRELLELEVDVEPLKLAALRRAELRLDERPPPRGLDGEPEVREDEDQPPAEDDWDDERAKEKKAPKSAKKVVPTPTLNRLGVKWHQLAKDDVFPLTFGREDLVEQVRAHVSAKDAEPLVLLGASGVGKTAVLQEVARRLVAGSSSEKPPRPFFHLDSSRLIAGEGFFGDWQRQTLDSFSEAHEAGALLHLGRLVDLLDAGKSAHSDDNVAQLLIPTLAAREVAVVAEATPEEWARVRDRNQSFARLFAPLTVDEPTPSAGAQILTRIAEHEGRKREVKVESPALDEVRTLVRRFRPYGSPLGNSVSFLRRLLDGAAQAKQPALTRSEVVRRFSIESGVPEELLRDDLPLDPGAVRDFLVARVKGQSEAVARAAQVVSVIKANLADPARPVATLLFAGPTGVGKTELTKALAERVFGSKDRMVRLDMGEFSGPDALARLIGDAGTEGFLVTAVRRQPFSVVLLDEVEKAHPVVFDALLSVLGEGRLTDGRGRLADFRSCVLVMTSNLGAQTHRPKVGFGDGAAPDARAHYLAEIRRFFRPELFNRIDDVVIFSSLDRQNLTTIVDRELAKVAARSGFGRLDVALSVSPEAKDALATWGHEPKYGARPLKRALERRLVVPAAAHLAAHRPSGANRLEVSLDGDALAFSLHSLPRGVDGGSRTELLRVCEKAAELRAEIRAWIRSPLMSNLRDALRLFERLSRQTSFWADRELADEQARRAAITRELDEGFAKLRTQVEAAEELAFEAYAARQNRSAEELLASLDAVRTAFEPLTERLFVSRFPHVDAATLTLVPGRNGGRWAVWLVEGYQAWAKSRGLRTEVTHLSPKTPEQKALDARSAGPRLSRTSANELERVLQQQGVIAAARLYRDKENVSLKDATEYVTRVKERLEAPPPEDFEWRTNFPYDGEPFNALCLRVFGDALPLLLSAEHGAHRIYAEGESFEVKVRFQRGNVRDPGQGERLEVSMPAAEVRRVWPIRKGQEQGLLKDQRTGTEHLVDVRGFPLSEILAAYIRHVVFGSQEGAWS
ncbi:MAG: AAA family ATPase [Myxococcota bacterium]